ncbi:MAG: hypothetical protein WCE82_11975 [Halobacteriota archaeon]
MNNKDNYTSQDDTLLGLNTSERKKKKEQHDIVEAIAQGISLPRFPDPNEVLMSEARALDKMFEESREAQLREQEARRREQEERDAVQKGIFDELHHLSEVQEQQQKGIDGVAASTAALATSSDKLYPWQKWGILALIILAVLTLVLLFLH